MAAPTLGVADEHDEEELEFDEAYLYFELNDTDGDLGIHGKVDGDGWKKVVIEGPDERKILQIKVKSGLRQQGMTELFFESTEPCFPDTCEDPDDEPLEPAVFFDRFPAGVYEWEGNTLENEEIEGEVYLSQRIPAAPVVASVGDALPPAEEGECWGLPSGDDVTVVWNAVTETHASLGSDTGVPLGDNSVLYYEFVGEIDETDYKMTAVVPPGTTEWTIPEDFLDLADGEVKFEIIVRVETGEHMDEDGETVDSRPGNQSAVESCFLTEEEDDDEDA
jgi:hypothetical protein